MLRSRPIRRTGGVSGKSSNRPRVGRLSVRTQIADLHVLDHWLTKGRHGDLQKLTATDCACFRNRDHKSTERKSISSTLPDSPVAAGSQRRSGQLSAAGTGRQLSAGGFVHSRVIGPCVVEQARGEFFAFLLPDNFSPEVRDSISKVLWLPELRMLFDVQLHSNLSSDEVSSRTRKCIMKLIVMLLFSFALCGFTMAANIKFFILGGQSNMAGTGAYINDLTPPWDVPQDDVLIWGNDLDQNVGWTPLRRGFWQRRKPQFW